MPALDKPDADRPRPVPYDNPERLVWSEGFRSPLENHGHSITGRSATRVIPDRDLASSRRADAMNAIAKLNGGLSVRCLSNGEIAVAATGVGEIGDILPAPAAHSDLDIAACGCCRALGGLRHGGILSRALRIRLRH
jgi:hypothetical protein